MNFGTAFRIFTDIDSEEYTDEQKGAAILCVLRMETHNSVKKDALLKVIRYLLNLAFYVPEEWTM